MPAFAHALGGSKGEDPFTEDLQQKPADDRARTPPPRPGDKASTGPDPVEISKAVNKIFHAMEGLGTNETNVLAPLQGRSAEEVAAIRALFLQRFGKPIDAMIAEEMKGKELEAARLALEGNQIAAAAATLEAAVEGWGSNPALVNATLRAIPDEEKRKAVMEEFKRRTGKSIGAMLEDELKGRDKEQAALLLEGNKVDAAAVRMIGAMEGLGTNVEALADTLAKLKTPEERKAVIDAYEKRTGHSFDADLASETKGPELAMLTSLSVGDMIGAKAESARVAMQGLGTDENALRQNLDGTSPDEAELVRASYAEGGGDLDKDLSGELNQRERLEIGTMLPKAAGPAVGSAAFEALLDDTTNSKARQGNETEMLFDGVNSFAERVRMINQAKDTINMQTFIFNDDETGWGMAALLAAKAKEGVKVRLMYDAVGTARADEKMFDMMREAGVEIRVYAPILKDPLSVNNRSHEKQIIVDGQSSIQGGMNVADEYALGGSGKLVASRGNSEAWRDADIRLDGPAVQDAQAAFLKQWNDLGENVPQDEADRMMKAPAAKEGGHDVRVVHHRPDQDGDSNIENLYLASIRGAQTSITIENAYFIPSEEMRAALIEAAKRGVKVRVMTNSHQSNDNGAVADASRYFYDELIAAGVHLVEKQGGTLHAKTASFDGSYSIVGSANLNSRSRDLDAEVVLAVSDPGVAAQIEQRFEKGLDQTEDVDMQKLAAEGVGENARQWLFSRASGIM